MDYSVPYTLFGLALAVGSRDHDSEPARFAGTVVLNVEFTYDPGYPARPASLGDPGEEGKPEHFDFKHVRTTHPVVAETSAQDVRVVVSSGADIYDRLSFAALAGIEADLIERRRLSRADAQVDAAVIARFVDLEALQ